MATVTEPSTLFLISTYTDNDILAHIPKGKKGKGIYAVHCSPAGDLKLGSVSEVGPNIAFILQHPEPKLASTLYATTERIDEDGEIFTMQLDFVTGKLKVTGCVSASGKSTCYLNIHSSGKFISAVNYWDAKLASYSLDKNGTIARSPADINMQPGAEYVEENNPSREEHWTFRQRWPHTHCMVTEPYTRKYEFVIDLGTDCIHHYVVNPFSGKLQKTGSVQLTPNLGPRHILFHPRYPMAYLVNELQSSVSVFMYNGLTTPGKEGVFQDSRDKGSILELQQTISTLPTDFDNKCTLNEHGVWKAASHSSEIRLHPSGRFLLVGNRGHDSIAVFRVHGVDDSKIATDTVSETKITSSSAPILEGKAPCPETNVEGKTAFNEPIPGLLSFVGAFPSGGKTPRNFNFSADGRFVLVGNQDSNNITLFKIDLATGRLAKLKSLPLPSPNYVKAIVKPK